jgi:hypothetical protein
MVLIFKMQESDRLCSKLRLGTFTSASVEANVQWRRVMANGKFVSYLRVSTVRQGVSGLGLEAQRESVATYLNGGRWSLVKEVVEVESGKRNDRPRSPKHSDSFGYIARLSLLPSLIASPATSISSRH